MTREQRNEYYNKELRDYFEMDNQAFKLILIPDKIPKKEEIIDFDEASREWRKNKISLGEGRFKYKSIN